MADEKKGAALLSRRKPAIVLRGISEAVNFSAIPLKGGAGLGLHA